MLETRKVNCKNIDNVTAKHLLLIRCFLILESFPRVIFAYAKGYNISF